MPILNSEIRSYNIIFTGKKERLIQSLQENNLTQYIFLNDLLMVLYVESNFNENIFNNINQIVWWERSYAMSSLINITNNLLQGVPVRQATDMAYMGNNLYNSLEGRGTVIAIIDSGIDYLNQDFLNEDGSKEEILPPADVVINPKQKECKYPYPLLCGAGVAFQFVRALYKSMGEDENKLEDLLSMLAIATVCDVVDLTGENRIFVKEGLKRIKETRNVGLRALLDVHDLMEKQIQSYALGFIIGPCINASGRLESAEKALNLFLEEDKKKAMQTAKELKELNDLRKSMTENGVKAALDQAMKYEAKGDKVLVLYLPDCHESIAGIIAGRIKDRLNHPVFVLTDAKDGIKGSGRSIEEYSMFEEMMKVKEVFTKFGGHPMAAGCSLEKEDLKVFRKKINENCTLDEKDFAKKVQIDIDMPVDYITMDLIHQLSVLEPFGKENKKPLFAHRKLKIERVNVFGKNKNVIKLALKSSQGTRIDGMIFEDETEFREKMGTNKYITCTYYPVINEYQGYKSLQINIQNYFFAEG